MFNQSNSDTEVSNRVCANKKIQWKTFSSEKGSSL